jgi:hypothetical protein
MSNVTIPQFHAVSGTNDDLENLSSMFNLVEYNSNLHWAYASGSTVYIYYTDSNTGSTETLYSNSIPTYSVTNIVSSKCQLVSSGSNDIFAITMYVETTGVDRILIWLYDPITTNELGPLTIVASYTISPFFYLSYSGTDYICFVQLDNPPTMTVTIGGYDMSTLAAGTVIGDSDTAAYITNVDNVHWNIQSDRTANSYTFVASEGTDFTKWSVAWNGAIVLTEVELLDGPVAYTSDFNTDIQIYHKQNNIEIIMNKDHLYTRVGGSAGTWQDRSETGTTTNAIIWDFDDDGNYKINYIIWKDMIYELLPAGGLAPIQTFYDNAYVGWGDWFANGADIIYQKVHTGTRYGHRLEIDEVHCKYKDGTAVVTDRTDDTPKVIDWGVWYSHGFADGYDYKREGTAQTAKTGVVQWGTAASPDLTVWSLSATASCLTKIKDYRQYKNAQVLTDNNNGSRESNYLPISPAQTSGSIEFIFNNEGNWDGNIIIKDGASITFVLIFDADGSIYYYDFGTFNKTVIDTYTIDTPQDYRMDFDCTTHLVQLYQDGTQIGTDLPFRVNDDEISRFQIETDTTNTTEHVVMIDALGFSWDGYTAGDNLIGWNGEWQDASGPDCNLSVIQTVDGRSNPLQLSDASSSFHCSIARAFPAQTSGAIDFWVRGEDVTDLLEFKIRSDTGTAVWFRISTDKIQYFYSSSWHDATGGGLSDETWYHFHLEFDCSPDTYDFYLNGFALDTDIPFNSTRTTLNNIIIFTDDTDTGNDWWIDDLGFSWAGHIAFSTLRTLWAKGDFVSFYDIHNDELGFKGFIVDIKDLQRQEGVQLTLKAPWLIDLERDVTYIITASPPDTYLPLIAAANFEYAQFDVESGGENDTQTWTEVKTKGKLDEICKHNNWQWSVDITTQTIYLNDGTERAVIDYKRAIPGVIDWGTANQESEGVSIFELYDYKYSDYERTIAKTGVVLWGTAASPDLTDWTETMTLFEIIAERNGKKNVVHGTGDAADYADYDHTSATSCIYEFTIELGQTDARLDIRITDASDNPVCYLAFRDDATIDFFGTASDTNLRAYASNTEYEIKIEAIKNGAIKLYVDGVLESTLTGENIDLERLKILTVDNGVEYWIDRIGISADGYTAGDNRLVDGWLNSSGAECTVDVVDLGGHKNVLELYDGSNPNTYNLKKAFSAQISGRIELWFRGNDVSDDHYFQLYQGDVSSIAITMRIYNNLLSYYNQTDAAYRTLANLADNIWYHFALTFDCATDKFQVYLDGVLCEDQTNLITDLPFRADRASLGSIVFNSGTSDQDYLYYIDALGFSWDGYTANRIRYPYCLSTGARLSSVNPLRNRLSVSKAIVTGADVNGTPAKGFYTDSTVAFGDTIRDSIPEETDETVLDMIAENLVTKGNAENLQIVGIVYRMSPIQWGRQIYFDFPLKKGKYPDLGYPQLYYVNKSEYWMVGNVQKFTLSSVLIFPAEKELKRDNDQIVDVKTDGVTPETVQRRNLKLAERVTWHPQDVTLASPDFDETDLTDDTDWNDLDLSAIVGAKKMRVYIGSRYEDNAADSVITVRTNGMTDDGCCIALTINANQTLFNSHPIETDANGVIEIKCDPKPTNWTLIDLYIFDWRDA